METKSNYSEIEQNKNEMSYHEMKCSQLTFGQLLWRDLFISLSKKTKRYESELFSKAKHLIYFANK